MFATSKDPASGPDGFSARKKGADDRRKTHHRKRQRADLLRTEDQLVDALFFQASSSSSCSSRSSLYSGGWEYDVFLCFRGDDTRHGFTSHLMSALSDRQIRTFIDDKLSKTESIDELISILQRCALSVVVFSEKFADSVWCLEEVATIARRVTKFGHRVLPVFYRVDPSDVEDDTGSYATTIDREYKAKSSYLEDKTRWMGALKAVANCAGHTSHAIKIESELIKAVVEDVQKQLIDMSPSIKYENLVGMGSRIFEVQQLLAMDKVDDTCIVGLWGMGGVGKTTLAKACYERITSSDKGIKHLFVPNINEKWEKHHDVQEIVHKLYSKLLNENNIDYEDLGITYRRERLSRLRVFIVLDNVESLQQLEQLALGDVFNLSKIFAVGSRIMVTTRNRKVLQNAMAKIYNVECLNDEESIRLFSLHAFKRDCPQDNWTNKSRFATSYCMGNPLALKILGGALFGEDMHYWQSFLRGLRQTGKVEIHNILRRSYNKLGEVEKRIFLDVACLLYGISRSRLIEYMGTMYPSSYAKVKDLIDRSLLSCVSEENGEKIEVHDLLKEMAWNIVNEEPKLGKRSRLVDPDDICKLLRTQDVHKLLIASEVKNWSTSFIGLFKGIGLVLQKLKKRKIVDNALEEHRTTEGIYLDLSKAKEMYLEADAFEGMNSLIFLKLEEKHNLETKVYLPCGGLDSLPNELRWLEWDGYPSKSLPSKFYPQHLVHLIIRHSPIQKCWEGYNQPQLVNLMVLDLSYCRNLIDIPNISSSLNLEELLLKGCKSLVEVPSHVQYLTKLITLDIGNCRNLKRLPPKLHSKLLKHVRMWCCYNVKHCSEIISEELVEFDMSRTSLKELPNAIYNVKQNGNLRICGENITKFPAVTTSLKTFCLSDTSIRDIDLADYHHQTSSELILPRFDELYLFGNSQLKSLPKNIWNVVSLGLHIDGSPLLESLPEISEPLTSLAYLHMTDCGNLKSLPSSISNITSLKVLGLSKTGIKSLPSSIQELRHLFCIILSHCKSLESIPSSIYELPFLANLVMNGCEGIRSLPELPPNNMMKLDVGGCKSLQALPSNTCKFLRLVSLHFEGCPQLDQTIPAEIIANFLVHASLSRSSQYDVVCSRSEFPEWLTDKSMNLKEEENSSVGVELPLPNENDQPMVMKGIVFGLVFSSQSSVRIRCDCKVGNTIIASWSYDIESSIGEGDNSSEKVSLMFDKEVAGREKDEAWYVKYAGLVVSFNYHISHQDMKLKKTPKIRRFGVSLMY
ncbi:Disease resistance protein RUN1 [Linum grandiflorum]